MKWTSKEPGNEKTLTTSKKDLTSETFSYQESEQYETERALNKQQHAKKNCINIAESNKSFERPFVIKNEYVMFVVKILFLMYYSTKSRNMNVTAINY